MRTHAGRKLTKKEAQQGVLVKPGTIYYEISVSKLRSKLGDMLNRVQYGKECVLVTARGKKVAQILPVPED